MRTDLKLSPQFDAVKDRDEHILWVGRPNLLVFSFGGIMGTTIGLLWMCFFWPGLVPDMRELGLGFSAYMLVSGPFCITVVNLIWLFLAHRNTYYAFSDKRFMVRSGAFGTDFKAIDYDNISDIEVTVNPIENLLGVGTIRAYSGRTNMRAPMLDKFVGIPDPYGVFKRIKEVSVDIKTDWKYPNATRPEVNAGYRTKYNGE